MKTMRMWNRLLMLWRLGYRCGFIHDSAKMVCVSFRSGGVRVLLTCRHRIPQNLRFHCADYESEWTLGQNSFDFIHLRHAVGSVSNYLALFRKVLE